MRLIKGNVERIAESEEQVARLKSEGFKELNAKNQGKGNDSESENTLEDMTVSELKELAKAKGISGCSGLSKQELLEVLKDVV